MPVTLKRNGTHGIFCVCPEGMNHLCKTAKDGAVLFCNNLRIEYEDNHKLKNVCEEVVSSYMECRNALVNSRPYILGSKVFSYSVNVMKFSDALVKSCFGACKLPGFHNGPFKTQNRFQKRLDNLFVIPQYYGGAKDVNVLLYKQLCEKNTRDPKISSLGELEMYKATIKKMLLYMFSRFKSMLKFGDKEDSAVLEIENYLLPKIFKNVNSPDRISYLCSEGGTLDLKQFVAGVLDREERILCVNDIRRIESSYYVDCDEEFLECQFEMEIGMVNVLTNQSCIHIVSGQARFASEDNDGRWYLSGFSWLRLN